MLTISGKNSSKPGQAASYQSRSVRAFNTALVDGSSHRRRQLRLINWLKDAEFTIEMNERSPVRLKSAIFNFAEKHGMLSDHYLSSDFAIENGECIDESGDTTCHFNPLLFVKSLWAFYLRRRKQLSETHMIMRQNIDTHTLSCAHYVMSPSVAVHTSDQRRWIHGQRTNGSHGQTMPFTVTIRRHNAYTSGEKPHALLEHIGRNRCLGDHATSLRIVR